MFDPIWKLALGLATGVVFGYLLQKGRVAKYEVIVGQFLGRDYSVVKIMGTAVVVGSVGIYALLEREAVSLHVTLALDHCFDRYGGSESCDHSKRCVIASGNRLGWRHAGQGFANVR